MAQISIKSGKSYTPCYAGMEMVNEEELHDVLNQYKKMEVVFKIHENKMDDGTSFYDISAYGELPEDLQDLDSLDMWEGDKTFETLRKQYDLRKKLGYWD